MEGVVFLIVLGAAFAAVLAKRRSSPAMKGSRGEQVVHGILRNALPASEYTILRDVTLPVEDGTVQIDHIVVSRFGIFVIETRSVAGWIFGGESDSQWIQALQHCRFEFPNPLRQNRAHVLALQKQLGLHVSRFHSLVVFAGKAEFRTSMPLNVMLLDRLAAYIQARATPMLAPEAVEQAVRTLEASRLVPGAAASAWQVESLRARHARSAGVAREIRTPPRRPGGSRRAVRALTGLASIALLLAAGYVLIGGIGGPGLPGGAWPAHAPGTPADRSVTAASPVGEAPRERFEPGALRCGYSDEAPRCACYDPGGGIVLMEDEACRALADDAAR